MKAGRRGGAANKNMAIAARSQQPPRILVVDIRPPHWAHTSHRLCDALENVFSLACGLAGPPRIPLFSLYVAQNQQECLLPFVPVRGCFSRLQRCIAELRSFAAEGASRAGQDVLSRAVQDGLQQFKQYTGQGLAGASRCGSSVEITVLTSQLGTEVAKWLEAGLRGANLACLQQLQVLALSRGGAQEPSEGEWAHPAGQGPNGSGECSGPVARSGTRLPLRWAQGGWAWVVHNQWAHKRVLAFQMSPSRARDYPADDPSLDQRLPGGGTAILGTGIDLQAVEDDTVALEMFFKTWLHDHDTSQEHLHLLLPSGALGQSAVPRASQVCVKCDVQERLLSPTLLPADCGGTASVDNATSPFWAARSHGQTPPKLRVLRALKTEGLCESVLFGLPLVIKPTSCWQMNWDELEANQHTFQALCHCLREREWLLLARYELRGETGGAGAAASYQVLLPSGSSLLLRPVATRELLLPCSFPLLPVNAPDTALCTMESILDSLVVEPAYNPLSVTTHLYGVLRSSSGQPPAPRLQRPAEWPLPRQQASRPHPSKARATVAPLRMALPAAGLASSLPSDEEEEFLAST
ncbi:meiosis 1 arrest protein [Varanus komodoensis]|uniref:meiosis 1 arrest protein n=1 Tax=Varanus komodoensis TaxID=61221 RepID=UPI001CF77946|nr:meiosis 1 arrest protein [Varanus komodoensis]